MIFFNSSKEYQLFIAKNINSEKVCPPPPSPVWLKNGIEFYEEVG